MKNKIVKAVKCHVGVRICAGSLTLEMVKHRIKMELWPVGVFVETDKGEQIMVPFSNITHIELMDEEKPKAAAAKVA